LPGASGPGLEALGAASVPVPSRSGRVPTPSGAKVVGQGVSVLSRGVMLLSRRCYPPPTQSELGRCARHQDSEGSTSAIGKHALPPQATMPRDRCCPTMLGPYQARLQPDGWKAGAAAGQTPTRLRRPQRRATGPRRRGACPRGFPFELMRYQVCATICRRWFNPDASQGEEISA
jgi:hypothetical protein